MSFFLEILVGGLLAGIMYSMVAIGFVAHLQGLRRLQLALQGSMVLYRGPTDVRQP